jgi:dolichyl-phosphate beta-glucosyltransferase
LSLIKSLESPILLPADTPAAPCSTAADRVREGNLATLEEDPPRVAPAYPVDLQMVVPAINEERRIGRTLAELCAHLSSRPWSSEVIVVDNGSADATPEVVDLCNSDRVPIEVVGCRQRGKGAAVREGIRTTTARWVGYCDADLSTPPEAIDEAVALVRSGVDVVIGSRKCEGAAYVLPQPAVRRVGSAAFHSLSSRLVGPIADTQCGFKVFRGDIARELVASSHLAGFAFDIEILAQAVRRGLRIVEMPVAWTDREGSTFRPVSDGVRVLRELIEVQRAMRDDVRLP